MEQSKGSKILFFSIFGLIILIGISTVLLTMETNSSPKTAKEAIERFKDGILEMDAKIIASTMHPNIIDRYNEDNDNTYEEELQSMLDDVRFEIIDYEYDSDYYIPDRDERNEIKEYLEDYFNIKPSSIEEIRMYETVMTQKFDDEKDYFEDEVVVFKVEDNWYTLYEDFIDDIIY